MIKTTLPVFALIRQKRAWDKNKKEELNALWKLPVYPVFGDKSQNVQTRNLSNEKQHKD